MHKFAEIIPILKLPKSLGIFDYEVPDKLQPQLKVGQLVKVPFRKKELLGLVFKLKSELSVSVRKPEGEQPFVRPKLSVGVSSPTDSAGLKPIKEIVEPKPFVTKTQLQLLPWLADYYFQSPALFLKTILPKILKRPKAPSRIKEGDIDQCRLQSLTKINRIKCHFSVMPKITQTKNHTLIIGRPDVDFYIQLIDQQIKTGHQSLLLLPEIEMTKSAVKYFQNHFGPNQVAVLHSKISNSEYYLQWKKIISNEIKIIIGTRSAVFAPVTKLGLIIIDSEHDKSFKQWDQNPRYSALTVAKKLAELTGAKIVMSGLTPKVSTYFQAKKEKWQIITPITHLSPVVPMAIGTKGDYPLPITTIIDMRDEYKKKNFSIFSERLQDELQQLIAKKHQAILFINRKGTSSFVICRDCGFVPKCKSCGLPYSYYATAKFSDADLYCFHCKKHEQLAPFCPKCSGSNFKPAGFGSQKVEQELKQLLPKLQVARLDSDVGSQQIKNIIADFQNKKIAVLVATQAIFSSPLAVGLKTNSQRLVPLVAIISADTALHLPDFSAQEKSWQLISQAISLSDQTVLVQTWNPDNFVIHFTARNEWQKFYQQELKNRQEFDYPPFGELIKLIFQDAKYPLAKNTANALSKKLKKYIKENKLPVKVMGPVLAGAVKIRGRFRFHLILKFKQRGSWLPNLMALAPDNWLIDVAPEELI